MSGRPRQVYRDGRCFNRSLAVRSPSSSQSGSSASRGAGAFGIRAGEYTVRWTRPVPAEGIQQTEARAGGKTTVMALAGRLLRPEGRYGVIRFVLDESGFRPEFQTEIDFRHAQFDFKLFERDDGVEPFDDCRRPASVFPPGKDQHLRVFGVHQKHVVQGAEFLIFLELGRDVQ